MKIRHLLRSIPCLALAWLFHMPVSADVIGDWGVIELGTQSSFTFTLSGTTTNFTDQYSFSLAGTTDVSYLTANFLATCTKGCGNPVVEFGIYNASGSLIDTSGATSLSAGSYVFQIKGTGMGAGNTAGSGGTIMFASQAPELVSPAPEPASWLLMASGLALLGWAFHRRSSATARGVRRP